jgi:hypothetical protein
MSAREIEEIARDLRAKRRRALEALPLSLACGALAPVAWLFTSRLGLALAVGAAVQLVLALDAYLRWRLRLEELATDASAHAIPEVRSFAARLARPAARRRLANTIHSMVVEVARPRRRHDMLYLPDRVIRYARELDALSRDLLSPRVRVEPVSMARCMWLVTQAAENPLYDPRLPAEDLGAILRRIRAGFQPVR